MKIGSLFSGIGGLELGLEWAGVGETVWQVELDPYARAVLARHWPHVTRYTDITKIDWNEVEPVDVLCGGFPCQDISLAGRGAGMGAGTRSGLWSAYADAICQLRPRYVVVENVTALLARGLGIVLGDLASFGYDAEWDCLPAAAVGAPHIRDRIFVLAYPGGERRRQVPRSEYAPQGQHERRPALQGHEPERHGQGRRAEAVAHAEEFAVRAGLRSSRTGGLGWGRPGHRGSENGVPHPDGHGCEGRGVPEGAPGGRVLPHPDRSGAGSGSGSVPDPDQSGLEGPGRGDGLRALGREGADLSWPGAWLPEPDVGRVAHGIPSRVDRLRILGNAVVPQVSQVIGWRIVEMEAA